MLLFHTGDVSCGLFIATAREFSKSVCMHACFLSNRPMLDSMLLILFMGTHCRSSHSGKSENVKFTNFPWMAMDNNLTWHMSILSGGLKATSVLALRITTDSSTSNHRKAVDVMRLFNKSSPV